MSDPIYRAPAPIDFEGCGWEYDHDERITYDGPDGTQWECRRCGAEGWEGR